MIEILPWYRIWINALIYPNEQTIIKHINQPKLTKGRAYIWAFIGFIGFSLALVFFSRNVVNIFFLVTVNYDETGGIAILMLFGFILMTIFVQAIATFLGGIGKQKQLICAFATYTAPLGIIVGILGFIPIMRYMIIPLIIYWFVLNIIATKAVHQINWIKAIICNIVVVGVFSLCRISLYQIFLTLQSSR